MNTISSISTVNSIFNSIEQLAQLCLDSVETVMLGEDLSVNGLKDLNFAKMQVLNIKKIIRSYKFISAPSCTPEDMQYDSFCWSDFSQEVLSAVEAVFPSYRIPSFSFTSSFNTDQTFLTNRRRFDILVYNILYILIISLKTEDELRATRITFHLAEDKDNFILHIRNNKKALDSEFVNKILSDSKNLVPDIHFDKESIDSELAAISKSAGELKLKVKFSPLKSGDKFEVYIPKSTSLPITSMKSPQTYVSDRLTVAEIFSDLS